MASSDKREDLTLPSTVINRLIDEAIPPNTTVSDEVRKVLSKTASVFVLYAAATAGSVANKHSRKTMNANDIIEAMQEMDFPMFVEPLEKSLEHYREVQTKKKEETGNRKSEEGSKSSTTPPTASSSSASSTPRSPQQLKKTWKQEAGSTMTDLAYSSDSNDTR